MMKQCANKYLNILMLSLINLVLFAACEKDVFIELKPGGGRLVLFSFLNADSTFNAHLSRSVSYSSIDDYERVYDGYIKVWRNGEQIDSFRYPYKELWANRKLLKINQGDLFEIIAGDSEGNIVNGKTQIPFAVAIEKLDTTKRSTAPDVNGVMTQYINCEITFNDPPNQDNYYQLILAEEVWQKDSIGVKYFYKLVNFLKDDPVFYIRDQEGSLLGGIDFKGTFPDHLFKGLKYSLKIRIPTSYIDKPLDNQKRRMNFMLLSQSSDYFDYLRSRVVAEYNYELPIVDPIKIHSNVIGGLGLVGGISIASDSLVFVGQGFN